MCVPAAQSSEEGTGFPGTGMTDSCAMLCGCQECNLAVLQEQVFLIPEPSLWSTSTAPALLKAIEPSWTFLAHSEPQVLGSCRYRDPTGHSTARHPYLFPESRDDLFMSDYCCSLSYKYTGSQYLSQAESSYEVFLVSDAGHVFSLDLECVFSSFRYHRVCKC